MQTLRYICYVLTRQNWKRWQILGGRHNWNERLYELHKLSLVNKMLFSEVQSIHLFFHTCTLLSILLTDDGCEP